MPSPKSFFYLNKPAFIVLIQEGGREGRKKERREGGRKEGRKDGGGRRGGEREREWEREGGEKERKKFTDSIIAHVSHFSFP